MDQRSPEWYELRKTHLGASDAPILMGVSPWRTPFELWQEKTGDMVRITSHQNSYMQRGIDMEPEALKAFENETGYMMAPYVLISSRNQFMMASLDGFELDGKAAVEIKCPGQKDHDIALSGKVPEKYIPQLQHQISVTGLEKIYYFSYSRESSKIIEVYRDNEYIRNLIKVESDFYFNHMLTKIPPLQDEVFTEIETDQWKQLSEEYKRIDNQEKDLAKRKEDIKDILISLSSSKNSKGNGIILQKIERKGIIEYQNIPELKQVNLEKYRKASSYFWKIK